MTAFYIFLDFGFSKDHNSSRELRCAIAQGLLMRGETPRPSRGGVHASCHPTP